LLFEGETTPKDLKGNEIEVLTTERKKYRGI
jgi:hypothetical protein